MTKARRPNLYLVMALRRKYGQTLGRLGKGATPDLEQDLAALGRVIGLFHPGEDLAAIAPIRSYRPERSRYVTDALNVLKGADAPISTKELSRRVLTARGVALTHKNRNRIECSLNAVLERMEAEGLVRVSNAPKRWTMG
jgi:hypothetical protein